MDLSRFMEGFEDMVDLEVEKRAKDILYYFAGDWGDDLKSHISELPKRYGLQNMAYFFTYAFAYLAKAGAISIFRTEYLGPEDEDGEKHIEYQSYADDRGLTYQNIVTFMDEQGLPLTIQIRDDLDKMLLTEFVKNLEP